MWLLDVGVSGSVTTKVLCVWSPGSIAATRMHQVRCLRVCCCGHSGGGYCGVPRDKLMALPVGAAVVSRRRRGPVGGGDAAACGDHLSQLVV